MEPLTGLTNEDLRRKFTNQFELVTYAIRLAENMIRSGRPPRVLLDVENPALVVLEEIAEGKDHFEEIKEAPPTEERRGYSERERDDRRAIFDKEVRLRMSKEDLMEGGDEEEQKQPKRKRRILT